LIRRYLRRYVYNITSLFEKDTRFVKISRFLNLRCSPKITPFFSKIGCLFQKEEVYL